MIKNRSNLHPSNRKYKRRADYTTHKTARYTMSCTILRLRISNKMYFIRYTLEKSLVFLKHHQPTILWHTSCIQFKKSTVVSENSVNYRIQGDLYAESNDKSLRSKNNSEPSSVKWLG